MGQTQIKLFIILYAAYDHREAHNTQHHRVFYNTIYAAVKHSRTHSQSLVLYFLLIFYAISNERPVTLRSVRIWTLLSAASGTDPAVTPRLGLLQNPLCRY